MALPDFHKDFRLHTTHHAKEWIDARTHTSSAIDTLGEHSICFLVDCGVVTGTVDYYLEESADNGAEDTWAKITGSDMPQVSTSNTTQRIRVLLNNRERYLRAKLVLAGGDSFVSAIALSQPTNTAQATACDTNI